MSRRDKPVDRGTLPKSPIPSEKGLPNFIEFIDSQAPNTKSAIQRHTAQHAAAQRREARLQVLRETARPRNLQWQRRPSPGGPSFGAGRASGASSESVAPAGGFVNEPVPSGSASNYDLTDTSAISAPESKSQPRRSSEQMHIYSDFEESVLQEHPIFCPNQIDSTYSDRFVSTVCRDTASAYLLISYLLSIRSLSQSEDAYGQEKTLAMEYRGQGQAILVQRLQDSRQACSDANIQAVLLFIILVADFGDKQEIQIHTNGLKDMVNQRGGLNSLVHDPFLHQQVRDIKFSRRLHLPVDCGPDCSDALRFSAEEQESLSF